MTTEQQPNAGKIMSRYLSGHELNRAIAKKLGWTRIKEFQAWKMNDDGLVVEDGLGLSGYPPDQDYGSESVPDWASDPGEALSLYQEVAPMIGQTLEITLYSDGSSGMAWFETGVHDESPSDTPFATKLSRLIIEALEDLHA